MIGLVLGGIALREGIFGRRCRQGWGVYKVTIVREGREGLVHGKLKGVIGSDVRRGNQKRFWKDIGVFHLVAMVRWIE